MPKTIQCHGCGAQFPHRAGADLYCKPECSKLDAERIQALRKQLEGEGFTADVNYPDSLVKDGIAITVLHARTIGLKQVLALHASAVKLHGGKNLAATTPLR